MAQAVPDLTQTAQTAQEVANDTAAAALNTFNRTDGWTIGPDGEFDGDPEEPRFAVLVFYCILVSVDLAALNDGKKPQPMVCRLILYTGSHDMCSEWFVLLEETTETEL